MKPEVSSVMRKFIKKCEISYNSDIFSKETLMTAYAEFVSRTIGKTAHNVGVIMHSGSLCYDALIVTYAAVSNILYNMTATNDIIDSLQKNDIVLYGTDKKQRHRFLGRVDGESFDRKLRGKPYIRLQQDNGNVTYVPEQMWRLIEPYNGSAKKIDGRGIKRKKTAREDFYRSVLEIDVADIPSVIDTTTVFVMPKEYAERLIKGIEIWFGNKQVKLLDLVTASYCTEEGEQPYGANPGKNEPVLKFCSKVSVARKLILSKTGNRHIGLVVMGQDMLNRGESELPELINRKSLQYVYLSSTADTDCTRKILDENDDVEVFACTKEFLSEQASEKLYYLNNLTKELANQVITVKHRRNTPLVLENSGISEVEYSCFRKSLISIKRNSYESEAKGNFVVHSHSLMNLLMTAPFSLDVIDKSFTKGMISVEPVERKLNRIEQWGSELPSSFQKDVTCVTDILKKFVLSMQNKSPKGDWLKQFINENKNKRIAIVVPKAYYAIILRSLLPDRFNEKNGLVITTPGRFDNSTYYHSVVVLGDIDGKKFNAFKCISSKTIIGKVLLVKIG